MQEVHENVLTGSLDGTLGGLRSFTPVVLGDRCLVGDEVVDAIELLREQVHLPLKNGDGKHVAPILGYDAENVCKLLIKLLVE